MGQPSPPAIQIQDLHKAFGPHRVLRGVNLTVRAGEFLVLVGPNGAGKTTLLRILATLARPTTGTVIVNGSPIERNATDVRRQLGLVSHQPLVYGDLTAEENLRLYGRMYGVPALENRISELLQRFGLHDRRHDAVRTFSRGMLQRLSIARAIIHEPSILLLDEPDTGLDQQATRILGMLLTQPGAVSRTIIMTTHQLSRAVELGSRVAVLASGAIRLDLPTASISPGEFADRYEAIVAQHAGSKLRGQA